MKKNILLLVSLSFLVILLGSDTIYGKEDYEEIVTMVAIVNSQGELDYYKGEEAQFLYEKMQANTLDEEVNPISRADNTDKGRKIEGIGAFQYKYRFVKEKSGTKYGSEKRISNFLENRTSQLQQLDLQMETSTSWSINISLTGKYKEAFDASVGSGWANTSSFSQGISVNVAPQKKAWVEFKPLLRYVSGKVEKYYIPRGPVNKIPVIVESKSVYSTSPKNIQVKFQEATFKATEGAFIWKEVKLK